MVAECWEVALTAHTVAIMAAFKARPPVEDNHPTGTSKDPPQTKIEDLKPIIVEGWLRFVPTEEEESGIAPDAASQRGTIRKRRPCGQ